MAKAPSPVGPSAAGNTSVSFSGSPPRGEACPRDQLAAVRLSGVRFVQQDGFWGLLAGRSESGLRGPAQTQEGSEVLISAA